VRVLQAAILQQAAEYISFLIAERQQLLELNRQYIAATRCLPAKRRRGSDGELSDDGSSAVYLTDQLSSDTARYKRRSPSSHCDSPHARSLPIKKRKDEVIQNMVFAGCVVVIISGEMMINSSLFSELLSCGNANTVHTIFDNKMPLN